MLNRKFVRTDDAMKDFEEAFNVSQTTALCSSLGSLEQIVNCKKPLEIVYTSKPQYYRTRDKV